MTNGTGEGPQIVRIEHPASLGAKAEDREIVWRNELRPNRLRVRARRRESDVVHGPEPDDVGEVGSGTQRPYLVLVRTEDVLARAAAAECHADSEIAKAGRIPDGERAEEHGVGDAEHGGGGTESER